MEEALENGKELSNSAHANGMNEWFYCNVYFIMWYPTSVETEVL
jgi:hypothetical protein